MADVFISYAREDRAAVEKLANLLEAAGLSCWWDKQLAAGARFVRETEIELNAAKAVLAVWTKHSIDSHWVADEAGVGRETGRLIPITLDGSAAPLGFRQFQVMDLSSWKGGQDEDVQALLRALAKFTSHAELNVSPAPLRASPSLLKDRRFAFAALALAAVVILGVGAKALLAPNASGDPPRLAVLKFESLGDTEPYFAEGVADEFISEASRIQGLEVIARSSSFDLSGARATPAAAARELGATLVLTGSVRKAGEELRVHAQLAEAPSGRQVWDQTFERSSGDIYALQRDIAVEVARAAGLRTATRRPRRVDSDALELYLRARQLWDRRNEGDASQARALMREAVARDPNFAEAWSYLSYIEMGVIQDQIVPETNAEYTPVLLAPALDAANRAIALDPSLERPYRTKEGVYADLGQWREALAASAEAKARGGFSWFAESRLGYSKQLIDEGRRFIALDPFNISLISNLSLDCANAGDTACARDAAQRALDIAPDTDFVVANMFRVLWLSRDFTAARTLLRSHSQVFDTLDRDAPINGRRYFQALIGDAPAPSTEAIQDYLKTHPGEMPEVLYALAVFGRTSAAAALLERWSSAGRANIDVLYFTEIAPLRRTTEFWALMQREGILAYWRESGRWPDFCAREPGVCDAHRN